VEPSAVGEILFGSRPPGTISALFGWFMMDMVQLGLKRGKIICAFSRK
jgi:hypothetical protein